MTKINLTVLAAKTRSFAPKVALIALAATAASVAVTAFNKGNDDVVEGEVVETDES
jgi:hypothetical protein